MCTSTAMFGTFAGCSSSEKQSANRTESKTALSKTEVQGRIDEDANVELARAFAEELKPNFDDFSVYITNEGEIAAQYKTEQNSASDLKAELYNIAKVFAKKVKQHGPETLTVNVQQVKMLVPITSVRAYANGNVNMEAFLETVQIKGEKDG
jgi:hypothetical protein